ncbi:MAG: ABC transporter permease [Candidatus Nanopelagicales bacterium]
MITDLRTELRKLATLRTWWLMALAMAGYMAFIGAVMAFSFVMSVRHPESANTGLGGSMAMAPRDIALSTYTMASSLGYVFPALFGALAVTAEFRHRTITPTVLVQPRRGRVLVAKLFAMIPFGLLIALAGTLGTTLAGAATLAVMGEPTFLADAGVLAVVARTVLGLAIWSLVGVGFGAVLTNQVAAIVVLLAFTQFVEPILRILLGLSRATAGIARFLPGAAGDAIAGASLYTSLSSGLARLLPVWGGVLVLLGYGLTMLAIARVTAFRRDIG